LKDDILIITNYFPPETGAASNRIHHLAEGLVDLNYNVQVITPLPNYPTGKIFKGYKGAFKRTEKAGDLTIHRLWIYASNSKSKLKRLIAMLSYSFSLFWFFIWHKIPKTVIIQSPPLLVAFTSLFFLNSKRHKLILNISDLWPIAGLELGAFKRNFSYKLLEKIERYNYKKAHLVLGQSHEILEYVTSICPHKDTFLYRNYPNFKVTALKNSTGHERKIKIVYAGLLGIAQGVYKLIQHLDYSTIELHIYGAGAEKEIIETYLAKHPKKPITYHGEVTRAELHKVLPSYDITIIPLLNRIYGSVPSKIFEYAHLGLPMLYFGGGEGESIIENYNLGWVAKAADYMSLNTVINTIDKKDLNKKRKQAILEIAKNNFDFKRQLMAFSKII